MKNPPRGGAEYGRGNTTLLLTKRRPIDVRARRETRHELLHRTLLYPKELRDRIRNVKPLMNRVDIRDPQV